LKGLHIISDFLNCENQEALIDHNKYFDILLEVIKTNNMTAFSHAIHYFGEPHNSGYTGVIVLGESHVSLHTFPDVKENEAVTIDVYTCSLTKDNGQGCIRIYDFLKSTFKPLNIQNENFIRRY
jgi:S-adenosylmethionine/arginine decarboxylase-like enzyme